MSTVASCRRVRRKAPAPKLRVASSPQPPALCKQLRRRGAIGWRRRSLIAVGLPAIAFPLYARLAGPRYPTSRWRARKPALEATGGIEAAIAAVEARLAAKPDDGKGWAVIAPVYMRLGRYDDAAHAYAEALRILGEDPLRRAAYGEALVAAAGGVVTADARKAFDRALTEKPGQPHRELSCLQTV